MHILLLWGTVFWASNIVAGKEAVSGFGAMGLAQLRLAGGAFLFVTLFLAWRGRPELRLSGRRWLALIAVASLTAWLGPPWRTLDSSWRWAQSWCWRFLA
jgi:drug/metabolite transporter (DMT)-like permease